MIILTSSQQTFQESSCKSITFTVPLNRYLPNICIIKSVTLAGTSWRRNPRTLFSISLLLNELTGYQTQTNNNDRLRTLKLPVEFLKQFGKIVGHIVPAWLICSELKNLEWWISRSMLDLLFFLISRLINQYIGIKDIPF